jgi:hypothetical protein
MEGKKIPNPSAGFIGKLHFNVADHFTLHTKPKGQLGRTYSTFILFGLVDLVHRFKSHFYSDALKLRIGKPYPMLSAYNHSLRQLNTMDCHYPIHCKCYCFKFNSHTI